MEDEIKNTLGGSRKKSESTDANSTSLTVNIADLQALVASAVSAALAASADQNSNQAKMLAEALGQALTPKKDARTLLNEENDRLMREQSLVVQERIRANILASQEYCQHLQGSNELSEWTLERSSFAMHQLDTGELIGLCTNCQKLISSISENPADRAIFQAQRRKPGNKMSRAGQRTFLDPYAAQKARTALPFTRVKAEEAVI